MTPATPITRNGRNHKPHDRNPYDSDSGSNNEENDLSLLPDDVNSCTTVEEIHAVLTHLTTQDPHIASKLRTLLLKKSELEHSFTLRLATSTPKHTSRSGQHVFKHIALSPPATTAQRVSFAVKCLDIEQSRVTATLEVLAQVAELKACVLAVTRSMGSPQDCEIGVSFWYRAGKIPQEIIHGEFAEKIGPSAEVPDLPSVTLESAEESVYGLFIREFEHVAEAADGEKVARFFKLFLFIGRTDI